MNVQTFTDYSFGTNNYLVWEDSQKSAVLIDAGPAIHPNHAILRKAETMLLLEINDGGHTRGESEDG